MGQEAMTVRVYDIEVVRALMRRWGLNRKSEIGKSCAGYPRKTNFAIVTGAGLVDVDGEVEVVAKAMRILKEANPVRYQIVSWFYVDGMTTDQVIKRARSLGRIGRTKILDEKRLGEETASIMLMSCQSA